MEIDFFCKIMKIQWKLYDPCLYNVYVSFFDDDAKLFELFV